MKTAQEIQNRLIADWGFKLKGERLVEGKCPACQKYKAYAFVEKPYLIHCPRLNKCGAKTHTKSLYPDLFGQYNTRFKPTRANPNATADAYMSIERGLDVTKLKGWYSQGKWSSRKAERSTSTVRFTIAEGVYMERFVENVNETNPETGEITVRNNNFIGKRAGLAWCPPALKPDASGESWIKEGDEIWVAESIIDAISLNLAGYKAISNLSAQDYPQKTLDDLKGKNITLIWAFDNDKAGKDFMPRHIKRAQKDGFTARAAYIPTKKGDQRLE